MRLNYLIAYLRSHFHNWQLGLISRKAGLKAFVLKTMRSVKILALRSLSLCG